MPRRATSSSPTPPSSSRSPASRRKQMSSPAQQQGNNGVEENEGDPEVWQPYQNEWYRQVVKQDIKFYVGYVAAFALYVVACQPVENLTHRHHGRFVSAGTRVVWTAILALFAVVVLWIDIARSTPPRKKDRKWACLLGGYGGHFTYLTVNILTTQTFYWVLCLFTELAWWWRCDHMAKNSTHGSLDWWIGKAVTATYAFAVMSSTLGTILTLLFLKFNWFEPAWRKDTLEMYIKRGNKAFVPKILLTHIPQLVVAFFDLIVLKQTDEVLEDCTPSLPFLLLLCVIYSATYLGFTHLNYNASPGNLYPYPFLDQVYKSWKSEIIFYTVITMFTFCICALFWFVAKEADMLESKIWGKVL